MTDLGKLIIFEGPDGAGKTTLSTTLCSELKTKGLVCEWLSFPGREEGTLGNLVYELHHNLERYGISAISPTSKQVLHIAAHIDAIDNHILPALHKGTTIILDRFWWSTWVYGKASNVSNRSLEAMLSIEHGQWGDVKPAVAFLVDGVRPHRDDEPLDSWKRHSDLYHELLAVERHKYPVEVVHNNGTIPEAMKLIVDVLDRCNLV